MAGLGEYRRKRDFSATSEPAGGGPGGGGRRFVIQEHHASHLHWDLRLETDGVLASWALPRGLPGDPKRNRLAVRTEDHPLEYLDFEGEIPAGSYGAGTMSVWDSGEYEPIHWDDKEIVVRLHGGRVDGVRFALFHTGERNWLIHRKDPPPDGWEPLPDGLAPMLACSGEIPAGEGWAAELKWDGVRALAFCEGGHVDLRSRSGRDITAQYPELQELGARLGMVAAVLDGEIVALDAEGVPSFERLQARMHLAGAAALKRRMADTPVTFVAFDLLHLGGRDTTRLPNEQRRALLERLELAGSAVLVPAWHRGDPHALLQATRERGLEGVVCKRVDAPYEPGRRSRSWIKVRNVRRESVVIGGWLPGQGGLSGSIGALLAGVHDGEGRLRYAGRVGSGITEAERGRLERLLGPLERADSPFVGRQPPRGSRFTEPRLVAEVAFSEWTASGTLRQPSYKGLRDDLDPAGVSREDG